MTTGRNSKIDATKYMDEYSLNQCSLMVRVDGHSLEVPLNFGLTAEEIRRLYPYLVQFANEPMQNPAVSFGQDDTQGKYADLSEQELEDVFEQVNKQARYWYGKSEASVLELAVRFALDIKLLGIQELADIFMPVSPLEKLQHQDVAPVTDEEADQIVQDMGLETEVDHEHDPGDEQDVALGIAGDLSVGLYDPNFDTDYLSDELDQMESRLEVKDTFAEILKADAAQQEREGHFATNDHELKVRTPLSDESATSTSGGVSGSDSGSLLNMYGDDSSSIFDDITSDDGTSVGEDTYSDDEPDDQFEEQDQMPDDFAEPDDLSDLDFDTEDADWDED